VYSTRLRGCLFAHPQVHNRHLQTQLSEKEVFRMQLDAARAALATAEAEKEAALKVHGSRALFWVGCCDDGTIARLLRSNQSPPG
jgi:hypothetical protein